MKAVKKFAIPDFKTLVDKIRNLRKNRPMNLKSKNRGKASSGLAESSAEYVSGTDKRRRKPPGDIASVTASEFAKKFGEYREQALYRPIAVTSHGRRVGYFISPEHFEQYLRLLPPRRAYKVEELPESTIRAIAKARVPKKYDHLNALLDED
jgi:PHD/YefM family antitoxin component YafN of YafNO toxin-antitoxin module